MWFLNAKIQYVVLIVEHTLWSECNYLVFLTLVERKREIERGFKNGLIPILDYTLVLINLSASIPFFCLFYSEQYIILVFFSYYPFPPLLYWTSTLSYCFRFLTSIKKIQILLSVDTSTHANTYNNNFNGFFSKNNN